jgi:drug/metabolite transporter (DMT)-like permease
MPPGDSRPDAFSLGAFLLAVVLGGANFLAVRVSNRELEPFWGATLRFVFAAVLFVVIALALRLPWPRGKQLALIATYGALAFAVSYALLYWALVRVTAGVAVIVLAIVPLTTVLMAAAQGVERLTWQGVVGALIAFAGIALIVLTPGELSLPAVALIAMLLCALTIAQSIILSKRISAHHPAMVNAIGMTVGALLLAIFSLVAGETWNIPERADVIWSVVYLVTLGSVGLFVLVLLVIRRWTASATSYMFVLFPVVTLALGAWLLDEPITLAAAAGGALVTAGVWFGAFSPAARRATAAGQAAATR